MPCDVILNANSPPTMLPTPPAFPGDKVYPPLKGLRREKDLLGLTGLDTYPMEFQDPFLSQTDQEDLNLSLSLAMELIEEEEGMDDPNHVTSILDSIKDNDGTDLGVSSDADSFVDSMLSGSASPVTDSELDIHTSLATGLGTMNTYSTGLNTLTHPVSTCRTVTSQTYPMKECPTYEQATSKMYHCVNPSSVCSRGVQKVQENQKVPPQQPISQFVAAHPTVTSLLTSRPLFPLLMNCQFSSSVTELVNAVIQDTVDLTAEPEVSQTVSEEPHSELLPVVKEEQPQIVEVTDVSEPKEEEITDDDPAIPLVALEAAGMVTDIKKEMEKEEEEEEDDEEVKEELIKTKLQMKTHPASTAMRFPALVASLRSTPLLPTIHPQVKAEPQIPKQLQTCRTVNSIPKASRAPKPAPRKKRLPTQSDSEESDDEDDWEMNSTTSEDEPRLKRRRLNNRVAAQRCRQRKREYFQGLKKEIQSWECQNTTIRYEIHTLEKELRMLSEILTNHECKKAATQQSPADGGAPSEQKDQEEEEECVVISEEAETQESSPKSKSRKNKHRHDKKRRKKSKHRG